MLDVLNVIIEPWAQETVLILRKYTLNYGVKGPFAPLIDQKKN
jgi:hypothetical protein